MQFLKKFFSRGEKRERTDIKRRFELIARTGQGSMSKVWRARDSRSGRSVALKVLDKKKTERFEARFGGLKEKKPLEGEIAVELKHPHIVQTYEFGWTLDDEQFLVMEFIDGFGMSYLCDTQNELMSEHRLTFMAELGDAIDYFHQANWIHRDICPRNVMVDQENNVKLIDFGLVVPNTPEFRKPGNRTGTANYMAPELIKRQTTDQRIDIFSYAVTCYEMTTSKLPWDAAETLDMVMQHINKPPTDIRKHVPEIDEQVAETIMRGIEQNPADRWSDVNQMTTAFRAAETRLSRPTGNP